MGQLKFTLLVLLLCLFQVSSPVCAQNNISLNEEDPIIPVRGHVSLLDAPIEIDIPAELQFVDGRNTKFLLSQFWGSDPDALKDVVGMLIPDTLSSIINLDKAFIISYSNDGFVNDKLMRNFSYDKLLKILRANQDNSYTNISWAWTPNYDMHTHSLSLPLAYIENNDTIITPRIFVFGRYGVTRIDPVASISDYQWLYENNRPVINSIEYKKGSGYEDYDPKDKTVTYNSVASFLRGMPSTISDDPVNNYIETGKPVGKSSFMTIWIRIIGIVAAILLGILLLLMLLVALTNTKSESEKTVYKTGINTLLRIGVFAIVYLLILTFTIFVIWVGLKLTYAILTHVISIKLVFFIFGVWIILGGFLFALIKSLFIFSRSEDPLKLEIKNNDAPGLFSLISEVANESGEAMPQKVYVSPEANASVFFAHPILSFIGFNKKNLHFGIGLLYGTNMSEIKAILAHEYGHFVQGSMRIGQIVSLCYNVISNLVNNDSASIVHPILKRTFIYVQRGFMSLSRAMEYEADAACAKSVGNSIAISALCKTEVISERLDTYNVMFKGIADSKHLLPSTYWKGLELFLSICSNHDGVEMSAVEIVSQPLTEKSESKVQLKNVWISHPLLTQRIDNINKFSNVAKGKDNTEAIGLIPNAIKNDVASLVVQSEGYSSYDTCNDEEYLRYLTKELDEHSFPRNLRPYFNRDIYPFPINHNVPEIAVEAESPFNYENLQIIKEFSQAISDYQLMMMFKNKQTGEKEIRYEGKVYRRKNVPIEKQKEYVISLEPKVKKIDQEIFEYVLSIAHDKSLIINAYDNVFYSQQIINYLREEVLTTRDGVAKRIGTGGQQDEETFKRTQQILLQYKAYLQDMIKKIEMKRLDPVMHVDMVKHFERLNNDWLLDGMSIDGDEIAYVFYLPEQLMQLFDNLAYYSKKILTDTIEGKAPLMYWNNSVASVRAQTTEENNEIYD